MVKIYGFSVGGRPKPAPRMTQRSKWGHTDYLDYKTLVAQEAMLAKCNEVMLKIPQPVVWIEVYVAGGKHGDWDNYGKTVCDALKGIAWKDDKAILFGAVEKILVKDKADERMLVYITSRANLSSLLSIKLGKELTM